MRTSCPSISPGAAAHATTSPPHPKTRAPAPLRPRGTPLATRPASLYNHAMADPQPVPARVHNIVAARAQFGPDLDLLLAGLARLDPLADAAIAALSPADFARLDATLAGNASSDVPPAVRDLLASVATWPAWVDWQRVERGCQLFLRAGIAGGLVLGLRALPYGYAAPAGNKPLVFSGRLAEMAPRRLAETARFVTAVCEPGALRRRGDAFTIALKVRLMHAQVRRLLLRSGHWRADLWGAPINQHDMVATTLLFSQVFVDGLRLMGLHVDPSEADDYIHLWRVVGWLLGVEEALLPVDERAARTTAEAIYLTQGPPDRDSRALVAALLAGPAQTARTPAERRRAAVRMRISRQLCRHLLGNTLADALEVPHDRPAVVPQLFYNTLAGLERGRRSHPALGRLAASIGRRYWDAVLSIGLGDRPAEFAPPERLSSRTALRGP